MLRGIIIVGALGLLVGLCEAQAATYTTYTSVKKVCAPGAHWYSHKVWRNGKKVWVGHCVPNRKY